MKRISLLGILRSITLLTLVASCAPEPNQTEFSSGDSKVTANVIYGTDGRLDVYQVTDDRLKTLADSTVALLKNSDISLSGATATLRGTNYGNEMGLCSTEKFREQDTAAFCSGTLVGPDTVLTAGHCITNVSDCQSTSFVFGFAVKFVGILPKTVASSEVYRCNQIIKQVLTSNGADFAVIKLDRAVVGHAPLSVRASGEASPSDSLVVIGHPVGLPTKITTGGTVRSVTPEGFFSANLDTYGGNSGSAVINASTGLIEGVLVRGEQDFVQNGNCVVSKVCAEGSCRGEDVTKISSVRPYLPVVTPPPVTVPPVDHPVVNPSTPPVTPPPVTPTPVLADDFFGSSPNLIIPDNNQIGITSSVQATSAPQGRKVIVAVNVKHSYIGDLVIKVIAPDGKTAVLQQRAGGSTQNLVKSYEVTSSLGSVAVAGAYKITVQDLAVHDVGTLISWSVQFKK
ncbi:MAG: trypsin-like peptidase domain-containing protein [Bdellovibrio sp.]|nr:trypsin-like peptidase domain-containing protein [Bdellovibrio sp.]